MNIYHVPCLMLEVISGLFGDGLDVTARVVEPRSSMWVLKFTPGYRPTAHVTHTLHSYSSGLKNPGPLAGQGDGYDHHRHGHC